MPADIPLTDLYAALFADLAYQANPKSATFDGNTSYARANAALTHPEVQALLGSGWYVPKGASSHDVVLFVNDSQKLAFVAVRGSVELQRDWCAGCPNTVSCNSQSTIQSV
jgi:hypothetical protein